jgi:hypothetical protein
VKLDWSKRWDLSPYPLANGPRIAASIFATGAYPTDRTTLPEQWQFVKTTEAGGSASIRTRNKPDSSYWLADGTMSLGVSGGQSFTTRAAQPYGRLLLSVVRVQSLANSDQKLILRGFGGVAPQAPEQRAVFLSSSDPFTTFEDNWWRPLGGVLKQQHVNYLPLGEGALRGYSPMLAVRNLVAANGELTQRVLRPGGPLAHTSIWLSAFGDVGASADGATTSYGDAGVGASLRGRIYDRDVTLRLDLPVLVKQPALAYGSGLGGHGSLAPRFVFSLQDVW